MVVHGYDHMVVFAWKEEEGDPEAVCTWLEVGIDGRHAEMAKAKRQAIAEVAFGMKDETKELDKQAKLALEEMREGPGDAPEQGKGLISLPMLKDRMDENAKKPLPNGPGGKKIEYPH